MTEEEKHTIYLNNLCCKHSCAGDLCIVESWTESCKGVKKCRKFQPKDKYIKEWKDYESTPPSNKPLVFRFKTTSSWRTHDYKVMTLCEYLKQDKENEGWAEINAQIIDYKEN